MFTNKIIKKILLTFTLCFFLKLAPTFSWAQETFEPPINNIPNNGSSSSLNNLHLSTIGTFSAGYVLQSYGYIGVLADTLSQDVYDTSTVRSMLEETRSYLQQLNQQLEKYQYADITEDDRKVVQKIQEIVILLEIEAKTLSDFSQTKSKADLERFEAARKNAWSKIKAFLK